ncbi:hypothetical protein [uncultured Desulfobacter sp.]|uniref:hypothetical protein n=1 Tax=uncultured Desulfobacter sp. TaxID=240139 RepID=UPI0029C9A994|nr:hypothetical protein [uncultured Desulfobacter sp.]
MKQQFDSWMKVKEGKKPNTAYAYANSIDKISQHYSEQTGNKLNIYRENDINIIKKISYEYSTRGSYADFGNKGNGTIRNAIATYVRFIEHTNMGSELSSAESSATQEVIFEEENEVDNETASNSYNFTYERDLKYSLIMQVDQLFPGYKIYGNENEGVEFLIEGKRIDLLLENIGDGSLLAIELKSGEADFRVFGQISMYLGLLSKQFPNKTAMGVIIAGEINDTLQNACLTNDKIKLKTYQMQLTLIDA